MVHCLHKTQECCSRLDAPKHTFFGNSVARPWHFTHQEADLQSRLHLRCAVALMTQLDASRHPSARCATSAAWMRGSSVFARRASSTGPTTISPVVKCRTYSALQHAPSVSLLLLTASKLSWQEFSVSLEAHGLEMLKTFCSAQQHISSSIIRETLTAHTYTVSMSKLCHGQQCHMFTELCTAEQTRCYSRAGTWEQTISEANFAMASNKGMHSRAD